jgi:hypothetical protein
MKIFPPSAVACIAMSKQVSKSKALRPICGLASLALPLWVATASYLASRLAPEGDSGTLILYVLAGYLLVASFIAGAILAIIALVRREKWRVFACLTLTLNAIALVVLLKLLI